MRIHILLTFKSWITNNIVQVLRPAAVAKYWTDRVGRDPVGTFPALGMDCCILQYD